MIFSEGPKGGHWLNMGYVGFFFQSFDKLVLSNALF